MEIRTFSSQVCFYKSQRLREKWRTLVSGLVLCVRNAYKWDSWSFCPFQTSWTLYPVSKTSGENPCRLSLDDIGLTPEFLAILFVGFIHMLNFHRLLFPLRCPNLKSSYSTSDCSAEEPSAVGGGSRIWGWYQNGARCSSCGWLEGGWETGADLEGWVSVSV